MIFNTSSHKGEKKTYWKIPYLLLDGDLKYFCRWGKSKFQQTQSLYIYKNNLELEASKKTGGTKDSYTFSNEKKTLSVQWIRLNPSLDLEIISQVSTPIRPIEIDLTNNVSQLAIELPTPTKTPSRTLLTSTPMGNNMTFKTPGSSYSSISIGSSRPSPCNSTCSAPTPSSSSSTSTYTKTPNIKKNISTPVPTPDTDYIESLWGDSDDFFDSGSYNEELDNIFERSESDHQTHIGTNMVKRKLYFEYPNNCKMQRLCTPQAVSMTSKNNVQLTGRTFNISCTLPQGGVASFTIDNNNQGPNDSLEHEPDYENEFTQRIQYLNDNNKPIIIRDRRATWRKMERDQGRYFINYRSLTRLISPVRRIGRGPTSEDIYIDIGRPEQVRFTCLYGISGTSAYKSLSFANNNNYWIPCGKTPGLTVLGTDIPQLIIFRILNELFVN